MNILLVRPRPSPETIGLQHVMIVEPLELEVLATLIRSPNMPIIVDMILERKSLLHFLKLHNPGIVCLTGYITHIPVIIDYCEVVKRYNPAIHTIVGGVHCEVCPEHFDHPSIDYRIVRNATRVFPLLLEHLGSSEKLPLGILRKTEQCIKEDLPPLDFFFPLPNRTLTHTYRSSYFYIFHSHVALLKTSFGCPHSCRFCFCRAITDSAYAQRPLQEVFDELATIDEKEIYIVDDDFLASKSRLEAFCSEVERLGIRKHYLVYGRADFVAANPELMGRFRAAGLKTIIVGFESFFDDELADYNKGSTSQTNRTAIKVLQSLNIDIYATIIASPNWDKHRFLECAKTLIQLGITYVNVQPFTPLPGTASTISSDDLVISPTAYPFWDLAHVTVRPTHMSISAFYQEIIQLYDRVLFRPLVLIHYMLRFSPQLLWKMATGSIRVRNQYLIKRNEARAEESKML